MTDEQTKQAVLLVFLLACFALAVTFAKVCQQRDEIKILRTEVVK